MRRTLAQAPPIRGSAERFTYASSKSARTPQDPSEPPFRSPENAAAEPKTAADPIKTAKTAMEPFTTAGAKAFREFDGKIHGHDERDQRQLEEEPRRRGRLRHRRRQGRRDGRRARRSPIPRSRSKTRSPPPRPWLAPRASRKSSSCRPPSPRRPSKRYVAEAGAMAETVAASMKESFSPLNERVTALVERVQTVR